MHGHLVAVEVGIKGGTDQRVQANGLTLDENGLKSLNAQLVQSRCPIEQYAVVANDLLENVPDLWALALDQLLGALDGLHQPFFFQFLDHKGLKQL